MPTRDFKYVQETLDLLTIVERNINNLIYKKDDIYAASSSSYVSSAKNIISELDVQHASVVNALIYYGDTYCTVDQQLATNNNSDYGDSSGSVCTFSYTSTPVPEKGFWEKTWNQIIYGEFSEDSTWLGTSISFVAGIFGVDAPMDVRDMLGSSTKGNWGMTILYGIALIPVVGVLGKGAANLLDSGSDVAKMTNNVADASSDVLKQGDNVVDTTKVMPYANSRPSYGKTQVQDVWDFYFDETIDGVLDPSDSIIKWDSNFPRNGQWDMGHIPSQKYELKHNEYMQGVITKEEFLEWYQNPANYRPELPSTNRSHKFEEDN